MKKLVIPLLLGSALSLSIAEPTEARRYGFSRSRASFSRVAFSRPYQRSYRRAGRRKPRIVIAANYRSGYSYQPVSYRRTPSLANDVMPVADTHKPKAVPVAARPVQPPLMVVAPGMVSLTRQQSFKPGMSRSELIQQWGQPAKSDRSTLIYNIANTSDGIIAPSRFVINLNDGKAAHGYVFGGVYPGKKQQLNLKPTN